MSDWNFALPEEDDVFKAMSDILYTYLYSISKHNPKRVAGQYIENYNYIYLDKGPNGEKKYSHKDTYTKLGLSKSTYYRKLNTLKDLGLIMETEHRGRKIFKIPFILSVCSRISVNSTGPPALRIRITGLFISAR